MSLQPAADVTDADRKQDEDMREAFRKISGDDMEIDAYELLEILNQAFMKGKEGFWVRITLLCDAHFCVTRTWSKIAAIRTYFSWRSSRNCDLFFVVIRSNQYKTNDIITKRFILF